MRVESHRAIGHTVTGLGRVAPTNGRLTRDAGKPVAAMTVDETEARDAQPMTTTCARCDKKHIGLTAAGRDWFRAHLAAAHPEVKPARRRPTNRSGWVKTAAEVEAREVAMVEVEARRKQMA